MKPTRPAAVPVPAGFVPVAPSDRPKRGLGPALQVTIGTAQRCPLCHDHLADDAPLVACAACLTVAHAECVDETARCSTLGCARAPAEPVAPVTTAPPAGVSRSWALVAIAALAAIGPSIAAAAVLLRPSSAPDVIYVAPPAPPPAPPPQVVWHRPASEPTVVPFIIYEQQAERLVEVVVPAQTLEPNVTVRGRITRCSSGAVLEVTGPEGDVRLPARPGPFELLVTLPRAGVHRITVTLREPGGQATTVEREVSLLHDDCETIHQR